MTTLAAPSTLAPAFRVKIGGRPLGPELSNYVTDLSVTTMPGTLDHFAFTVANPYPAMRWTHTRDADLLAPGAAVEIELGYVGRLMPGLAGDITRVSPSFSSGGAPTLAVSGQSRLHRLTRNLTQLPQQDTTDKQVVEQMARSANLTPRVEVEGISHKHLVNPCRNDLALLKERAKALDCEVFAEGGELVFRPRQIRSARLSLTWGESLISFQPTLDVLRQPTSVTVRGWDCLNKCPIVGRAGPGDEQRMGAVSGPASSREALSSSRDEVLIDEGVTSQEEADRRAWAIYNARTREFITGSGSCVGTPELRGGEVIELGGLGDRFNGPYYVEEATHTLGGGGYQTRFRVKRSGKG